MLLLSGLFINMLSVLNAAVVPAPAPEPKPNTTAEKLKFSFLQITGGVTIEGDIVDPVEDMTAAITVTPFTEGDGVVISFNTAAAPTFNPAAEHALLAQSTDITSYNPEAYIYSILIKDPANQPLRIHQAATKYEAFGVFFAQNAVFVGQEYTFINTSIATSVKYISRAEVPTSGWQFSMTLTSQLLVAPETPIPLVIHADLLQDAEAVIYTDYNDPSLTVEPPTGGEEEPVVDLDAIATTTVTKIKKAACCFTISDSTIRELAMVQKLEQMRAKACQACPCKPKKPSQKECKREFVKDTMLVTSVLALASDETVVKENKPVIAEAVQAAKDPLSIIIRIAAFICKCQDAPAKLDGAFAGIIGQHCLQMSDELMNKTVPLDEEDAELCPVSTPEVIEAEKIKGSEEEEKPEDEADKVEESKTPFWKRKVVIGVAIGVAAATTGVVVYITVFM